MEARRAGVGRGPGQVLSGGVLGHIDPEQVDFKRFLCLASSHQLDIHFECG